MKKKLILPVLIRLVSIRKEIKYAFLISILSILIIELIFKRFASPSQLFFRMGEIYLMICYSIVAATIFFFINQHLPIEDKKLKYFRYINNKVMSIDYEIRYVLENLTIPESIYKSEDISYEIIKDACKKKNPKSCVFNTMESSEPFADWYEYFNYKVIRIKNLINDLILLNESIDPDLMEKLLVIENILYNSLYFDRKKRENPNLETYATAIFDLTKQNKRARQILIEKYSRFWYEHSVRYKTDKMSN